MQNTGLNHPAATPNQKRARSGWDAARRKRHAAAMRTWAPWASSTGPKTRAGKAKSSQNAYKHGARSKEAKEFAAFLRLCRRINGRTKQALKCAKILGKNGVLIDASALAMAMLKQDKIENPTIELLKIAPLPPRLKALYTLRAACMNKHNAKILQLFPPWHI